MAAFSGTCIFIFLTAPQWLAPLIPMETERKIGSAITDEFPERTCDAGAGEQALGILTEKLDPDPGELDVRVIDMPITNAVALPGGRIVLFSGLIDQAESPDEVAGVLAHEIGHVRKRHVMESLLRQLGLSVLLSGSDFGASASGILSLQYGRGAERAADKWSIEAMRRADISPEATADFFGRMEKEEYRPGWADYLASHPDSGERKRLFAKSAKDDRIYEPALSDPQWQALRNICGSNERALN